MNIKSIYQLGSVSIFIYCVCNFIFFFISGAQATETNQLVVLKQITVGPDDQYQGVLDPTEQWLVFTRKSDLAPHLCKQNLKTGEVTDVISPSADSQEPTFSPDGKLAFTYFKFHASGDICYRKAQALNESDEIICLSVGAGDHSSPFWKSNDELGYLTRDPDQQSSRIIIQNIHNGYVSTITEGLVWSPSMKPGGRFLFYSETSHAGQAADTKNRSLSMIDLGTSERQAIHFDLPGISGFPAVSSDEQFVYFSHYLNDTNHDNIIDANDNSVIFRIKIDELLKHNGTNKSDVHLFPEQLTSVGTNCSLPHLFKDKLLATCNSNQSLNIFQIPLTGIVPSNWDETLLWNSHQTSRTYHDRILILNTMRFRYPDKYSNIKMHGAFELLERLLSDHIMADDMAASKYYGHALLDDLRSGAVVDANYSNRKEDLELILLLFEAREKKLQQSSTEISPQFKREIERLKKNALALSARTSVNPKISSLVLGFLESFLETPDTALTYLRKIREDDKFRPLERYLYFELAAWVLPRKTTEHHPDTLKRLYFPMLLAPELNEETKIYYAALFLRDLGPTPLKARLETLHELIEKTKSITFIYTLLKSEEICLRLIQAPENSKDGATKLVVYQELDKIIIATSSDYFLRKAIYIRAINNFADASEFKFLNFIASNWIRYTKLHDTEYIYSKEIFTSATLERAYDSYGLGKAELASNYFHSSFNITDDLESHVGYMRSLLDAGKRKDIDDLYLNLRKRNFIGDSYKLVQAVLLLMDVKSKSPTAAPIYENMKPVDQALELLESMQENRDSPVRYLLLGYCHLRKLLFTAKGYEVDMNQFEAAHKALMLAYDLARDDVRIAASALMNLALLHQRVQNHGMASKFFAKRKELGLSQADGLAEFEWLYARSLFYSDQPGKASEELNQVLQIINSKPGERGASGASGIAAAFLERRAFYLESDGQFEKAAAVYSELLKTNAISGERNLAKVLLSDGYCLFKLGRDKPAREILSRALEQAKLSKNNEVRIKLLALGFLGQLGTTDQRLAALKERNELLPYARDLIDDWASISIQIHLQMAKLYEKDNIAGASDEIAKALKLSESNGDATGYLSNGIYNAIIDSTELALAHRNAGILSGDRAELLQKIVTKSLLAYDTQVPRQAFLVYQGLKIRLLLAALSKNKEEFKKISEKIDVESTAAANDSALAKHWKDLKALEAVH